MAGGRSERAPDDVAGEQVRLLGLAGAGEELERLGGLFAVVVFQCGMGLVDAWQQGLPFGGAVAVGLLLELPGGALQGDERAGGDGVDTEGGGWVGAGVEFAEVLDAAGVFFFVVAAGGVAEACGEWFGVFDVEEVAGADLV